MQSKSKFNVSYMQYAYVLQMDVRDRSRNVEFNAGALLARNATTLRDQFV